MIDDLSDAWAEIRKLQADVRRLQVGTPLQNAAISRGALRVVSAEGLIVDGSARVNGMLLVTGEERVDGTLRVTGTLIVSGNFNLEGTTTISGPTSVTGDMDIAGSLDIMGPTNITGPTTITGTFDIDGETRISGDVRLTGDFIVADGGRIRVGDMIMTENRGGSFNSPVQIVVETPLLDIDGGIRVDQGAIFEGQITATALQPITMTNAPEGAFPGAIMRDASGRLRVVIPN